MNLADEKFAVRRERGRLEIRRDAAWSMVPTAELAGGEAFARDVDLQSIKEESFTLTIDRYLDRQARDAIDQFLDPKTSDLSDLVENALLAALTNRRAASTPFL